MTTCLANGSQLSYDSWGDPHAETLLLIAGLGTQRIRFDGMGHDLPAPLHPQVADRIARVAQKAMPREERLAPC